MKPNNIVDAMRPHTPTMTRTDRAPVKYAIVHDMRDAVIKYSIQRVGVKHSSSDEMYISFKKVALAKWKNAVMTKNTNVNAGNWISAI